jgi:hypothetical protein
MKSASVTVCSAPYRVEDFTGRFAIDKSTNLNADEVVIIGTILVHSDG